MWKACGTMKENNILVSWYGLLITVRSYQTIQGWQDAGKKNKESTTVG